jgi:hypothetical protein
MRVQGFQAGGSSLGPRREQAPPIETLFPVDGVELFRPREGPERGESRDAYEARKRREAEEADEVTNRPLRRVYRAITDYLSTPANERLPILDAIIQGRSRGLPAAAQAVQQAAPAATPPSAPQSAQAAQTAPVRDVTGAQRTPPPASAGLGASRTPPPAQTPPLATTQQQQQPQVPAFDIDALTSAIEQTGVIPPEILEERKALAAARKAQLERQQAAAQRYGAGLEESPEDRRMRAFATIAEGLSSSPRLSKGLSAALSGLTKSEAESRRAKREGMKEVMTLEDAAANLQIAMQEQSLADRTGDNKLKTAAAVAVAQAQQAYQKALFDQGIAAREVAAKEVAASNTGISRSSSTDNTLLRERADALSKRIETLAKKADPLSPYSQEEKKKAREQMEVLQTQLDRLLGLAPAAPTAASGSRIREVLVINPATGLLVQKPQP